MLSPLLLCSGAIREAPTLVFGGLQPSPCRASKTEGFLAGKSATDAGVLAQALDLLASELPPDPSFSKGAYREMLARGFLYKALLATVPRDQLPADLLTTVTPYVRPLSSGQVSFDEVQPRAAWPCAANCVAMWLPDDGSHPLEGATELPELPAAKSRA